MKHLATEPAALPLSPTTTYTGSEVAYVLLYTARTRELSVLNLLSRTRPLGMKIEYLGVYVIAHGQ
jgi:hypothetical protein